MCFRGQARVIRPVNKGLYLLSPSHWPCLILYFGGNNRTPFFQLWNSLLLLCIISSFLKIWPFALQSWSELVTSGSFSGYLVKDNAMCGAVTDPVLCLPMCQGSSLRAPRDTCGDPVPEKNKRRLDNVFSPWVERATDHRSYSSQTQLGESVSLLGFPAWSMETQNNWGTEEVTPIPGHGWWLTQAAGLQFPTRHKGVCSLEVSSGGQLLIVCLILRWGPVHSVSPWVSLPLVRWIFSFF